MRTQVIGYESESERSMTGGQVAEFEIQVQRSSGWMPSPPLVTDLPDDMAVALATWLDGHPAINSTGDPDDAPPDRGGHGYQCGTCGSPVLRVVATLDAPGASGLRWKIACNEGHEFIPSPGLVMVFRP